MTMKEKKLLVVQVAALSHSVARSLDLGLDFRPGAGVFPAVTCTAQAGFRTATLPAAHGVVANGRFDRTLRKVMFWEQSSALAAGPRIWSGFRRAGGKVAMLFWQQSMGEDVDFLLTPAPIHKHHGGMIEDCYSVPGHLYGALCRAIGSPFRLRRYWGPAASARVGEWIAAATAAVLSDPRFSPGLCMTYLPSLDYDFQRWGPGHARGRRALSLLRRQLATLLDTAGNHGYEALVLGDYAISECSGPAVFPNRILAGAGLMKPRNVRGRLYADLHSSRAFALTDHEVAHIYVPAEADRERVRNLLAATEGVDCVLDAEAQAEMGLRHEGAGELVAVAAPGRWFAYPWWSESRRAPDFARHVDIHNKPGFDPGELFFSLWPPGTSQDTARVRGTHGRSGEGREIAVGSTIPMLADAGGTVDAGRRLQSWLED